jgi:hypothetical protein
MAKLANLAMLNHREKSIKEFRETTTGSSGDSQNHNIEEFNKRPLASENVF